MTFAKHVGQAPALDAANMVKGGTKAAQAFPEWKRWVEGSGDQDGKGLRDVVEANAGGLDSLKSGHDSLLASVNALSLRVAALEEQPADPFPVGG